MSTAIILMDAQPGRNVGRASKGSPVRKVHRCERQSSVGPSLYVAHGLAQRPHQPHIELFLVSLSVSSFFGSNFLRRRAMSPSSPPLG